MKVSDLNPTFYAASINPLMHYLYMWPVQFFRKGEPCESLGEQLQGRLAGLLLQLPQDEGEWETASAWSSHGCCNITSCSLAKSDFNRSGVSFSCWYGGPSDSDNWGNGLKLKSENPEAWFPGTKIENWAFLDEFKQLVDLRIKPSLWEASSADSWWRWTSVITSGGRSTMGLMLSIRWLYLFPTISGIECLYIES